MFATCHGNVHVFTNFMFTQTFQLGKLCKHTKNTFLTKLNVRRMQKIYDLQTFLTHENSHVYSNYI